MFKIKVLYINQTSKISGAEKSLLSFLERVDREIIEPIVVLPDKGPFYEKIKEAGIETILIPYLIKFGEAHSVLKIPRIIKGISRLCGFIKRRNIHIVHSNSPRAGFMGGLSAKLSSAKSIIHVRDIYLSPFSNLIKASILNILSDKIIAVSEATRKSVIQKLKSLSKKVEVIYNGIDLSKIDSLKFKNIKKEMGIREDEILIESVGILHPVKGHDTFIKAIQYVRERFPNIKALIVGDVLREEDKFFKKELETLTKELGISEQVIFTGFRDDVLGLMNSMDLIVLPSKYEEPFPRVLLEASILRKPILATKVGGIPEIIKDGFSGLLFPPSDYMALADAIKYLIERKDVAKRFGLAARKIVEESFRIEKHVDNLIRLYIDLIGRAL
ncbi:MAG: glycosyltransferase [Candidatus Aminicenantia bacterium]